MPYGLRTLLILLTIGLPVTLAYAQKAPNADAQKGRMTTYYDELILKGTHPLEAQIKDDLLYTRLFWDRPQQAFQRLDELEKELDAIQSDADSVQQAIARARNLIHEDRISLEVNSTPLEEWAKRLDESPSNAATISKYVRKAKDLFGFRGNARANAYSVDGLAQVQSQLTKWEQQVTDEGVKKRYATAKSELARLERAFAPKSDSREQK
jgi:cell division septum initiation protein DivIVA